MSSAAIEGVVPILVTPFFEDGHIDEASLCSLIDFNIDAGVHGLGVPSAVRFSSSPRPSGCR